jgi:hypothetical protein
MHVSRILRLAFTLAYLRPVQWAYLPLRRMQQQLPAWIAAPDVRLKDELPSSAVVLLGIDDSPLVLDRAAAVARREFTFVGQTLTLPDVDWGQRYVSHLWNYNLHYFGYSRDLAWAWRKTGDQIWPETFQDLALSWIRGTKPGQGDGWSPYPTSLRTVNWLYALALFGEALSREARDAVASSIAMQTSWLERRLEHHIQANHLQKNYYALAVAGLLYDGRVAARWRRKGLRGTWDALREQVLRDGGHYERSPMYHCIALQDFLELAVLSETAGEAVPADVVERLGRMVRALGVLSRPGGQLHLFNDAAEGVSAGRKHLEALAARVLPSWSEAATGLLELPDTGYFGYHDPATRDRLIVDAGPPGPRHQPGHAHCDMLSFELDLAGLPFAVDSGVHGYVGDPYREYVRSTRAHNTVMVAGREQHELWGAFRMGRAGSTLKAEHAAHCGEYRFLGACSPFHDMAAIHRRTIHRNVGEWCVSDRVVGASGQPLRSFLHLHPRWTLRRGGDGCSWVACSGSREISIIVFGADHSRARVGESNPPQGWYCPHFGTAVPAAVLEIDVEENDGREFGYMIRVDSLAS